MRKKVEVDFYGIPSAGRREKAASLRDGVDVKLFAVFSVGVHRRSNVEGGGGGGKFGFRHGVL